MGVLRQRRIAVLALAALVGLAIVGWVAARQIRSPAQVAADTAPPKPSPITVPLVRRTLSTEVIVRGTVRYGAPQAVVLGTSKVKQGGSDIVTRPPHKRAQLSAGDVAMAVDGRPVFVLRGAIPMHRDLSRGDVGPDVRQLEEALARLHFPPGAVDGRYDSATQAAVAAFYLRNGWDPFGATDLQLEQLRTAEAAAAQARDAHLQAVNTAGQARRGAKPSEVAQARIDAVTAREAVAAAVLRVAGSQAKLDAARRAASSSNSARGVAEANARRDQAAADADVAVKRAALDAAKDEQRLAAMRLYDTPLDAPPADREAAAAAARQADAAVGQAQAELDASIANANAVRVGGAADVQRARDDAAKAARDARLAVAELRRARQAVVTARQHATLSSLKVRLLTRPADTGTLEAISASTAQEARRTQAEVTRLSAQAGVQVPANELLFFPTLPLRVDAVKARRGSQVSGTVMNVTNSRLAVDSSLSVSDQKLVRAGDPVAIEDPDLGIKTHGTVSQVATTPGTNRVDPSRFYLEVIPAAGPVSLVGSSVKLTIAVKSTKGAVLAAPVSALSLGGDGNARVQVRRDGRNVFVKVAPGLAARGLVEVRPAGNSRLRPGDLVIVGSRGGARGP